MRVCGISASYIAVYMGVPFFGSYNHLLFFEPRHNMVAVCNLSYECFYRLALGGGSTRPISPQGKNSHNKKLSIFFSISFAAW